MPIRIVRHIPPKHLRRHIKNKNHYKPYERMVNYQEGKIYKIHHGNLVCVGSITQKLAEWYEANREAILARQADKITCGCGSIHRRNSKSAHLRTAKHLRWAEAQE